ncbi:MAG TPA: DUF4394 domain-containing protein [Solirubrobacteraceae bacterium]|jgi:hypothetical protein|nr:DUF4394 domain-containing protein [Solirubrobacteraceae bacterium]
MRGLRRATPLAVGLALAFAFAAPAGAADPVLGLTTAGQLVRFDADTPTEIPTPVMPAGLNPGDQLIAVGATDGIVQALGRLGQIYAINLETYAAVPVDGGLSPGQLTSGVGLDAGPFFPMNVVLSDGSVCAETDYGNCYRPDASTASGLDILAAASGAAGPPSPIPSESPLLYVIDGATDALMTVGQPPYGSVVQTIGPLGVPVDSPTAFAVSPDGGRGFLITGQPAQTEYSVSLSSGVATSVGPVGPSAVISSIAAIPPASVGQPDPVTGTYDTAAGLTGASASGLLAFPDPAVEGRDTVITLPVNRSGDPTGTASIAYTTIDTGAPGLAVPGVDYVPVSGTVQFAPGQQYGSFSIRLLAGPAVPASWPVYLAVSIGGNTSVYGSIAVVQTGHAAAPLPTTALLGGLPATQTIAAVLAHGIRVPVTCRAACTVDLVATTTSAATTPARHAHQAVAVATRLGARVLHATGPGTHLLHLALTGRPRRVIRDAHRATVTLLAEARYPSGANGSDRARLTLVAGSQR